MPIETKAPIPEGMIEKATEALLEQQGWIKRDNPRIFQSGSIHYFRAKAHAKAILESAHVGELVAALENYLTWFDDDSKSNEDVKQWLDDEGIPAMRDVLAKIKGE